MRLKYAGRCSDEDEDRAAGRDVEFERELAGSAELRGLVEAADDAAGDERLQHLSGPIGAAPVHPDQVLFGATGASPQPDKASVLTCVVGTAGTVAIG